MTSRKAREYAKKKAFELLTSALYKAREDAELARQQADLAFNLARKMGIKLPRKLKRSFCRRCHAPLVPGLTARIRIKRKTLVVTCLNCGWIRRYELRGEGVDKGEGKKEKGGARGCKDREERPHSSSHRGDKA
ncbi:MAG: ribonuclease P protein component 4 [Thermoprotei archaeon]